MNSTFTLRDQPIRLAMVTALINAFVFALMPLMMMWVASGFAQESDTSTVVRPEGAAPVSVVTLSTWMLGLIIGFVLRTTAVLTLNVSKRVAA